jgi:hypothetical protein
MDTFTTFTGIAFSSHGRRTHTIAVDGAGNVRVWDSIARHFTSCHCLTEAQMARLRKKAQREYEATPAGRGQFHGRM